MQIVQMLFHLPIQIGPFVLTLILRKSIGHNYSVSDLYWSEVAQVFFQNKNSFKIHL